VIVAVAHKITEETCLMGTFIILKCTEDCINYTYDNFILM
jgi:hypothetical protein